MQRAHATMTEQVREAYIRGGMDMASRGAQRAALEDIRDTEAQGTGSLPLRPATVPLTNAPVGQTPASSSRDPQLYAASQQHPRVQFGLSRAEFDRRTRAAARASPQTYAANVPPPMSAEEARRARQNAELSRALRTIAPRRQGLGLQ